MDYCLAAAGQRQLGASFFFKKGEGEYSNTIRFFTTIAIDLVDYIPRLRLVIRRAINANLAISKKVLKNQFKELIL